MKKLIPKNKRRPFPYFNISFPILIDRNGDYSITRYFKFTETAIYRFYDEDQHDVNKLFGFSFGMHHNNSVRFGWRPTEDLTKIEIVGYEYVNKLRVPTIPICDIELNTPCPDEQTKIANFLSSIDVKINQTRMQIEKAEVWKKGLMQQMFC